MSRPAAEERLGRLLAIVPWVAAQDGPLLADVCARFGVSERELLADLDLLFLCGVYPFTPDSLIEVDLTGGRVWIRMADWFRRPLRITAPEGLALLGAGAALLATPEADPDGALGRALAKLEAVLGVGATDAVEIDLGPVAAPLLATLQQATAEHRKVRMDYYSFGRDGRSTRTVRPWQVFNDRGQWYVRAWCEQAVGERLFRVDRVRQAEMLEERFEPPAPGAATGELYAPDATAALVVLDLQPAAHWIAEQYPHEGVEKRPDDVLRVRLRTGHRAWLERLLLRAGPQARVVEGDAGVGPAAARRILGRYRQAPPAG